MQSFCEKSLYKRSRLSHRANMNIPTKKSTPHVIPYCRFTKLIIYYLGSKHNIHRRPESQVHVTRDDFPLGNLKFVLKDEKATPAKQTKPVKEKTTKPPPKKKIHKGKVAKFQKGKSPLQLVDEDEEAQLEPEPLVKDEKYDLQRVVKGKGKAIAIDELAALSLLDMHNPKKRSTTNQYIFQRWDPATQDTTTGPSTQPQDDTSANVVHDTPSPANVETGVNTKKTDSENATKILDVGEEHGKDISNTIALEEKTAKLDEGQAGSDPGKTPESRPPPDHEHMEEDQAGSDPRQSHVALTGPNFEPMHEDFIATVYPRVHESLKHTTEEKVLLENPPSLSGTVSSMKTLDDAFTFGDQFMYDKPTEEEPGKANVDTEVKSMVIPVPEEERPETPKPDWAVPLNDLPKPENNWADALTNSYQDPKENKLLQKTGDMGSFIKWYCKQIGKIKLRKGDLKADLMNTDGNQLVHDIRKPLPPEGPSGQDCMMGERLKHKEASSWGYK
nr:hypothetical protein [Tanacetum cinerariifolium]